MDVPRLEWSRAKESSIGLRLYNRCNYGSSTVSYPVLLRRPEQNKITTTTAWFSWLHLCTKNAVNLVVVGLSPTCVYRLFWLLAATSLLRAVGSIPTCCYRDSGVCTIPGIESNHPLSCHVEERDLYLTVAMSICVIPAISFSAARNLRKKCQPSA